MEITIDSRDELDSKIREKIANHECIHEPELLDRITDIMIERDILIDDIQCYHDKLKDVAETNKSKIQPLKEYVNERMADKQKVPEFDEGYVVIDVTDNHILDNKVFNDKESAKIYRKECAEEMPSLVENSYVVMKVTRDCLQYGAFPYEKQLYFIYDLER